MRSLKHASNAPEEFDDDLPGPPAPPPKDSADPWGLARLLRFARTGNPTATLIALCEIGAVIEQAGGDEKQAQALVAADGARLLVNILSTKDEGCVLASLKLLAALSDNAQIRSAMAHLDGVKPLVDLLNSDLPEHRGLAAAILARLSKNSLNRSLVRHHGGVPKLVRFLKSDEATTASAAAEALKICSRSNAVRLALRESSALPLLSSLLASSPPSLLPPLLGILENCASDPALASELVPALAAAAPHLRSSDGPVRIAAAKAAFRCAESPELRAGLASLGALEPLVAMLSLAMGKEAAGAAAGAVAKCGLDPTMLEPLIKMGAYGKLAELLAANADDAALSTTVAEALGTAAAGSAAGRKAIRESGAIITLVGLLSSTNAALLCNVAFVLGKCSQEPESCAIIDAKEGLRLLFSLLKQSSRRVQSAAALAVSELALHSPSAAETVRSFVGALELLVPLLRAPDTRLQAHACKAVASIARDPENLAVISDHGVVGSLSGLVDARDEYLRRELALAIEACCQFGTNRQQFGTNDVVAPLAKYLKSSDPDVQRAAARALFQLSSDADNSRALAATGVLPTLVELVGSECGETSRAAAGILANVRMQAPR